MPSPTSASNLQQIVQNDGDGDCSVFDAKAPHEARGGWLVSEGQRQGPLIDPTVFANATNDMKISRE
jgi:acyl-CoA reductase-like NAD-dependent aldehyde dehydrogenase